MESIVATHCLDACAVIAYLRNEAGAEVLKELIERPTTFLVMHVCNLGEVYMATLVFADYTVEGRDVPRCAPR